VSAQPKKKGKEGALAPWIHLLHSAFSWREPVTKLTLGRVEATVSAIGPDGKTELDRGRLDLVDNEVDQSTGTIRLKASFPNKALKLWPGDFVNGRITVDLRRDGLTVPTGAVRHGPKGDFVWVVKSNRTIAIRAVEVGQIADSRVLIERGLRRGAVVVTDRYYRLENGTRVEIERTRRAAPDETTNAD
jgi:membrane fusion protein, multidrug efflux system